MVSKCYSPLFLVDFSNITVSFLQYSSLYVSTSAHMASSTACVCVLWCCLYACHALWWLMIGLNEYCFWQPYPVMSCWWWLLKDFPYVNSCCLLYWWHDIRCSQKVLFWTTVYIQPHIALTLRFNSSIQIRYFLSLALLPNLASRNSNLLHQDESISAFPMIWN